MCTYVQAEERRSKLEDRLVDRIQSEEEKEKQMKEKQQCLRDE